MRAAEVLAAIAAALALGAVSDRAWAAAPPHAPARETCQTTLPNFVLPPPAMYAADATAGQDWQYVAWRPDIWYWSGSAWKLAATGQWLWSWAYDSSPATYWYDYAGRYVGTTTAASGKAVVEAFNVTGLGYYYLVSNEFFWYAGATAPSSYSHLWGTDYAGDAVYDQFCYF